MSIADVARRAGVSVSTASRVISNSGYPVRESTRQRVLQAVEELNYSPSILARALVTQQSKIIGVIVHDILDPYFAEIVRGVQDAARVHDYLTIVCNSDRQIATETSYLRALRDYRADGVVLAGGGLNGAGADELNQTVRQLQEKGARIVALAPQQFDTTLVTIDNVQASCEVTDYLLSLGHRRIGFVRGPAHLITAELREAGYRAALERAGIEIDPQLIAPGNFNLESGRAAAESLMALAQPPTAIFASNDEMAIGCLAALRKGGYYVPRDVSVVGFDDLKLLQNIEPLLTTVRVPLYELGTTAMQQLLHAIRDEPVDDVTLLPHELVIRDSSGPPLGRG